MNLIFGVGFIILGLIMALGNGFRGEIVQAIFGGVMILFGVYMAKRSKHLPHGKFRRKDWES